MSYGLFLGIGGDQPLMPGYQITSPIRALKYVTVFTNMSTKLDQTGTLDQSVITEELRISER
jgi:hypothetical protein